MTKIQVATWNLEWAKPDTDRGQTCAEKLRAIDADVVCLTEAFEDSLRTFGGYSASSHPDTGYPIRPGRRKVVIWSRWQLENVDTLGSENLPTGRYVSATVNGPAPFEVIGVCIPWKAAHVNDGHRNREWWEDHKRYLSALNEIERFKDASKPTIVLGDFNQRMSGKDVREDVHEKMTETFKAFKIPTESLQDSDGKSAIDHIAIRGFRDVGQCGVISRFDKDGSELSDHFGVRCDLMAI